MHVPRLLSTVVLAIALSGCAAAAAAPVASTAPIGHSELQLIGDWTGVADDRGDGVLDMTVGTAADDGSVFDGDLTFAIAGAESTETVHAAMTPHGHLVAEIGDDASIELHIVDPATLDYCMSRYGTDFVYSCGRLTRLPDIHRNDKEKHHGQTRRQGRHRLGRGGGHGSRDGGVVRA